MKCSHLAPLCAAALSMVLHSSALAQDQAQTPPIAGPQAKALNPDISVDGLFSATQFNQDQPLVFKGGHDPHLNGFNLQQVELSFGANVDPYFRADANLVLTPGEIEIEEAYGTTMALPANLQLKFGQFFTSFGRHNPTHPHTWDFADKPLVLGRFFGGDGLRNVGAQVSWLTPLPWYSELIVSGQNASGETAPSFRGEAPAQREGLLALARWTNFVTLSESLGLNVGASYLTGPNAQAVGTHTKILGGDLYLRLRNPSELSYVSLQFEVLKRLYDLTDGRADDWGWYAQVNYRLPGAWERWHLGLRYDHVGPKGAPVETSEPIGGTDADTASRYRISPVVTFYPSEFSKVRLQYNYDHPDNFETAQHAVTLQAEFLMGAHGAHRF